MDHAVRRSPVAQLRRLASPFGLPALSAPMLLFLGVFFFYPAARLLLSSVMTQDTHGIIGAPLTWGHYEHFFRVGLYLHVFWNTLRISLLTGLAAAITGYPIAIVMSRSRPWVKRLITLIVITPLMVSVVVRSYGWQLILANSTAGPMNWVLINLGLIRAPLQVLYSQTAVIIGQLHVNLPMMVLPLAAALDRIDPNTEDCARTLGAPWWRVFWRITLPLSFPGLAAGFILVFSLTAGAYVVPVILGGTSATMLGNLIQQQIFVVFDWPFGAAIAAILVVVVVVVNTLTMRVLEQRRFRRVSQ